MRAQVSYAHGVGESRARGRLLPFIFQASFAETNIRATLTGVSDKRFRRSVGMSLVFRWDTAETIGIEWRT